MNRNLISGALIFIILLSSVAIQIPLHNRSAVFNDEGCIFNLSENVLNGTVLFKEKPSYVFPGIFYVLALLYKIFGVSFLISRYAAAVLFSLMAILIFLISRQLMEEWLAFSITLVFVAHRVWAFPVWTLMGYATFSIFFLGITLLLLFRFDQKPRLVTVFLAGLSVAIATMFKQDYGVFAGMGFFFYLLLWPSLQRRDAGAPATDSSRLKLATTYVLGGMVVCVPYFTYLVWIGALDEFLQITFVIPLTLETTRETTKLIPLLPLFRQDEYLRDNWLQYAPAVTFLRLLQCQITGIAPGFLYAKTPVWDLLLKLIHYLPYFTLLGVGGLLGRQYLKRELSSRFRKTTAVLLFGVSIFLTQHKPFDYAHLMQMYMPVFLLVGCLISAFHNKISSRRKLLYPVLGGMGILLVFYFYHTVVGVHFLVRTFSHKLEGPRAGIYLREQDRDACADAVRFIQENTSPEEPIFVVPYHSLFYFLSQRHNPTKFELLWPVKVFPDMDQETMRILDEKRVKYIVKVPIARAGLGSFEEIAPEIAQYVEEKYVPEKVFGDQKKGSCFIIMKRKDD